jgi:5'-3' exonuclease
VTHAPVDKLANVGHYRSEQMIPPGVPSSRLLCLLDLSWWLSRAWYQAIREVLNGADAASATDAQHQIAGRKTIALVVGWLARLLSPPTPACLAVAVDSLGPTFRHELTKDFPEERRYKAGRPARPVAYHRAANTVLEVVQLHAIPVLAAEGYEADDAIATATRLALSQGLDVAIVAQDKDFAALVQDHVWMWAWVGLEGQADVRDPAAIWQKYGQRCGRDGEWIGVLPRDIHDWLAIVGDTCDNVLGVEDVGELGAAQLLRSLPSGPGRAIDRLLAWNIAEVSADTVAEARVALKKLDNTRANLLSDEGVARLAEKRKEAEAYLAALKERRLLSRLLGKVRSQQDRVLAARELVTLRDDCPIVWRPQDLPVGGFDLESLRALYHDLGFHAMASEVRSQPKRTMTEICGKGER